MSVTNHLFVIDITEKRVINEFNLYTYRYGAEGIVFNSSNKSIYIVSLSMNSILKYDEYAKKILASLNPSVPLQINKSQSGMLGRFRRKVTQLFVPMSSQYREVIAVNPLINKLYVLYVSGAFLYKMDG